MGFKLINIMSGNSLKIIMKRIEGLIIPFDYNYYLSLNFYEKLSLYDKNIRKLHYKDSFSLHTFSNFISNNQKSGLNGLDIPNGFIIFRSLDKRLIDYLRLGLSINPLIRIINTKYVVTIVKDWKELGDVEKLNFRTLSPVLVRDFNSKNKYVDVPELVEKNLLAITNWQLSNLFKIQNPNLDIKLKNIRRKTVRISSRPESISKTVGFEFEGTMTGDPSALKVIYYRGLGSKTGLGLGLIEVVQNAN
jgi:CRISPR-associated endoribonuclease Cas6